MVTGIRITTEVPIGKFVQIKADCDQLGNEGNAVECHDYTRVNSTVAKDDNEKYSGPDESV